MDAVVLIAMFVLAVVSFGGGLLVGVKRRTGGDQYRVQPVIAKRFPLVSEDKHAASASVPEGQTDVSMREAKHAAARLDDDAHEPQPPMQQVAEGGNDPRTVSDQEDGEEGPSVDSGIANAADQGGMGIADPFTGTAETPEADDQRIVGAVERHDPTREMEPHRPAHGGHRREPRLNEGQDGWATESAARESGLHAPLGRSERERGLDGAPTKSIGEAVQPAMIHEGWLRPICSQPNSEAGVPRAGMDVVLPEVALLPQRSRAGHGCLDLDEWRGFVDPMERSRGLMHRDWSRLTDHAILIDADYWFITDDWGSDAWPTVWRDSPETTLAQFSRLTDEELDELEALDAW